MARRHFQAPRSALDIKPSQLEKSLGTPLLRKLIKGIESQHATIPGVYADGTTLSTFDVMMYEEAHSALRLHRAIVLQPNADHEGSESTMFRIS